MNSEAVLRARVLMLDEGRIAPVQELRALRVLAPVAPAAYLPKLSRALVKYAKGRTGPERLALLVEAVDAAERMDEADPVRPAVLLKALNAYQKQLDAAGRPSDALAARGRMLEAARAAGTGR
ncbi:hypothetical protein OG689_25370 [Kitasatospora sp. NBC_00240]|uniref:hypothetical protein n=1 Tax=Kitasatospora sp. NBC_00240 TaxID=2903567 RepID=UPI0022507DC7|nr:hypothetical protein [Kitasatospora sp. NBC_00240]MCX5212576.1 hypothetical protein [Kitasatospora sp. NBC_00240]